MVQQEPAEFTKPLPASLSQRTRFGRRTGATAHSGSKTTPKSGVGKT